MAKVLQRNPDGSILVEEDPQTTQFDPITGTSVPLQVPIPGKKFVVRQDLVNGTFTSEPYTEPAPVAPEVAVNLDEYAVPPVEATPADASSAPMQNRKVTTRESVQTVGTPEQRGEILDQATLGGNQQLSGAEKAAQVAIERATQESATIAAGLEEQEDLMGMQAEKERVRQEHLDRAGQQLQETFDNLEKTTVDPSRFYSRMDTGSQIAAGLAIGLGAVGQALMNLPDNPAMSAINRAIDRDIESQKMDIDKQKGKAVVASNIFSQMRDKFGDDRLAAEASRAAMLKLVDVRLQNIAASTKNKELAAQAETMSGKINEDIAKTKGAILKELAEKTTIDAATATVDVAKASEEIWKTVDKNPQVKKYLEAREGLREFEQARKSNVLGVGLISFIANGLSQGSFGPEMLNMLRWETIPDQVETALRQRLGGSADSPIARKLSTFLTAQEASMRSSLGPVFERLDGLAKSTGAPGLQSFISIGPTSKLGALSKGKKRVGETP